MSQATSHLTGKKEQYKMKDFYWSKGGQGSFTNKKLTGSGKFIFL